MGYCQQVGVGLALPYQIRKVFYEIGVCYNFVYQYIFTFIETEIYFLLLLLVDTVESFSFVL